MNSHPLLGITGAFSPPEAETHYTALASLELPCRPGRPEIQRFPCLCPCKQQYRLLATEPSPVPADDFHLVFSFPRCVLSTSSPLLLSDQSVTATACSGATVTSPTPKVLCLLFLSLTICFQGFLHANLICKQITQSRMAGAFSLGLFCTWKYPRTAWEPTQHL